MDVASIVALCRPFLDQMVLATDQSSCQLGRGEGALGGGCRGAGRGGSAGQRTDTRPQGLSAGGTVAKAEGWR